jgi:voltage-gated potassium channel
MDNYMRNQIKLIIAILFILIFGTLGYYVIEDGWTLLDSFYMVFISITTVGFGEIHNLSPGGRLFTILIIFLGLGTAATFATYFARFILEGELKGIYGRKKVQDRIKKISGHYIVCGHGRTGRTICLKLHEIGIPFVIIDSDSEALAFAEQRGYLTVEGNAGSDIILISAGIERASGIVICISDDATTLFISLAARELNPKIHIIAQGHDPGIEARIIRAGADVVVYPLKLGGEQIARLIARQSGVSSDMEVEEYDPGVMGYHLRIFRHFDDEKITIGDALIQLNAVRAVALKKASGEVIDEPSIDLNIGKEDSAVMLVRMPESGTEAKISEQIATPTWSDNLSIGIASIDEQHRSLVILISKFQEALSAGKDREEIAKVFDKLLDYTMVHFKNEEEIMKKYDYPEIDTQIREHRNLTQKVMELNRHKRYIFSENIIDFLYSWLVNHIMVTDKKLGQFLSEKGFR